MKTFYVALKPMKYFAQFPRIKIGVDITFEILIFLSFHLGNNLPF